jgi:serine phosphatase RsbU (regulator of sigma subunit)/anti-sigma regulatory factor (Ser/Thr protein kinase)/anti-anti-sigma regulatory factor
MARLDARRPMVFGRSGGLRMEIPDGLTNDVEAALSVVDQLPILVAGLEGPDFVVQLANGATRAAVRGVDLLGAPIGEAVAALDSQTLGDRLREVYRTGVPFAGEEWRMELPGPDGEVSERFITFTYSPWRFPDGTMRGVVAFAEDSTEAVLARRAADAESTELRKQYEHARQTLTALQEVLLPAELPVLPRIDLSARYLLAERDTAAGGDWFDAVVLDDGRVALAVGDVVGHGMHASATMGQLRSVLSAYLHDSADPAEAVTRLDRFAERIASAAAATVCAAILDPDTGDMTYCTAGHPPPLIASTARTGQARFVEPSGGSPLGTGGAYQIAHDRLEYGDVLLLYTDGIIERPDREPVQATLELLTVTGTAAAGRAFTLTVPTRASERVTEQVLELLTRITGHSDDITLFAAQRRHPVEPFTRTAPAVAQFVRQWRVDFDEWLHDLDVDPIQALGVSHALVEMTTNAVEHAYSDAADPGEMTMSAVLHDTGVLEVSVRDTGIWRQSARPTSEDRGHGLALAGSMVDHLAIDHDDSGTTGVCRTRLTRPPALVALARQTQPAADSEFSAILDGDRLLVSGSVDITTAPDLERSLRNHMQHATRSLTVDMSQVTHLASAGVQILAQAIRRSADLILYARPGSPAQHVLVLTRLPHTTGND